jgi:hypothetical protein
VTHEASSEQWRCSTRLRLYPDIAAILAGGAPLSLGTIIPDDYVQAYALNTTGGIGWQLGPRAALDIDYVHSYGDHQAGFVDRNLPAEGAINTLCATLSTCGTTAGADRSGASSAGSL